MAPIPVFYNGPLAGSLAALARLLGQLQAAEEHLEAALEEATALGARPSAARLETDLAELHLARGRRQKARTHLDAARAIAEPLGLAGIAERVRALGE